MRYWACHRHLDRWTWTPHILIHFFLLSYSVEKWVVAPWGVTDSCFCSVRMYVMFSFFFFCFGYVCVCPSKHTTPQKRRYNVAATSRRCTDVVTTLLQRCVFVGVCSLYTDQTNHCTKLDCLIILLLWALRSAIKDLYCIVLYCYLTLKIWHVLLSRAFIFTRRYSYCTHYD